MNELIFTITPITAPIIDIGFKPPIISGIAEITNKYCIDFYYWNGKAYSSEIDYMNSDNQYYNDTAYHIDDMIELRLFELISDDDAGAGGEICIRYDDYEICIAPAIADVSDVAGDVAGGDDNING